mgnify:CR=1 FL=1
MKIKLILKNSKDDVRELEKAHAIKLLNLSNSQFELPKDSPFEFVDNELKRRKVKEADTKQSTKGSTRGSSKTRK